MTKVLQLFIPILVSEYKGALRSLLACTFGIFFKIALLGLRLYINKNAKLDNWVNWEWLESSVLPVLKLIH